MTKPTGAPKFTKHRDGDLWSVRICGRRTDLVIIRGCAPKFREPTEWEVYCGDDLMITAPSLHGCMNRLECLLAQFDRVDA